MRMQLCEFDPNHPLQTTDHFILDRKRITSEFDSNHPLQSPEEQETQRNQKNQSTGNPTQVEFRKSQKKRRGSGSFRSSSQSGETKNPNKSQARTQRGKIHRKIHQKVHRSGKPSSKPQFPTKITQRTQMSQGRNNRTADNQTGESST